MMELYEHLNMIEKSQEKADRAFRETEGVMDSAPDLEQFGADAFHILECDEGFWRAVAEDDLALVGKLFKNALKSAIFEYNMRCQDEC